MISRLQQRTVQRQSMGSNQDSEERENDAGWVLTAHSRETRGRNLAQQYGQSSLVGAVG